MNARTSLSTSRRIAFAAWGWAMLLVVAFSAMPTGGQSRSRLVGSAFDPASISVALNPKQPKTKAKAQVSSAHRRNLIGSASDAPPLLLAASLAIPPARWTANADAESFPRFGPLAEPRSLTRAHGARAPPSA